MRFPSLALSTLYLAAACHAFTAPHRQPTPPIPSSLFSTAEAESTSAATTALSPSFQAARDASVSQIESLLSQTPQYAPLAPPLIHFMDEYFRSLSAASSHGSRNPDGTDITPQQAAEEMMRTIRFGTKYGLGENKYRFENVRHAALRGIHHENDARYQESSLLDLLGEEDIHTDFYEAGCDFFRPSMDLANSLILGVHNLEKATRQLEAGDNVVFLANHQSEADPQVVSCLFEKAGESYGELASRLTYVAGHKVTTDPLAIPFSMGRNLLCIHSKKHIDSDPETKSSKSKQNMAAMNEMLQGLKEGGMAIWVAPSGGRDRRVVSSGKIPVASFDPKTVDMFRLMGNKSRTPTHFYPMAMVSYDLCPPPDVVEAGVGEKRNVRFTPVGIKVMDEVPNVGGAEKRHLFTHSAEFEVIKGYEELLRGMGMEKYM